MLYYIVIPHYYTHAPRKKEIVWTENEAEMCYFDSGGNLGISSGKNECREECITTERCTHYVWSDNKNCWLKEGYVTKKQAKPSQNKSNICGIVSEGISRMIKIKYYYYAFICPVDCETFNFRNRLEIGKLGK